VLAVNYEDLEKPGSRVYAYPQQELPENINVLQESIFFTRIDKKAGTLTGYQVGNDWAPNKVWQLNLAQREGQSIHQVRSMHQTASEIDHQYYPPTSFVEDNLIYKYLDSNLFAVSTLSSDSSIL